MKISSHTISISSA